MNMANYGKNNVPGQAGRAFSVIFEGRLKNGMRVEDVKKKIAELYGKASKDVDRLFSAPRVILKKNATLEACLKIRERLEKAGAECRIVRSASVNRPKSGGGSGAASSNVVYLDTYKLNDVSADSDVSRILKTIVGQLRLDPQKDIPFLLSQIERFEDHRHSLEIRRAIGRMIFDMLPQERKDFCLDHYQKLSLSNEIILQEAKIKLAAGDLDGAEALIVSIMPDASYFQEDGQSRYFCFDDPFEAPLFNHFFRPEKKIRFIPPFVIDCSQNYAYILIEKGEYEKAFHVLGNALRYNPVNLTLLFEKNELNKIAKRWSDFKRINDFCISIAYTPEQIARAYRNYGYMYFELDDFDAAICCYLVSLNFESSAHVRSELFILSQRKKAFIDIDLYMENAPERFEEKGILVAPSRDVVNLALDVAKIHEESRRLGEALHHYNIGYRLTQADAIKEKMETILVELEESASNQKESD
jgi:tetratricopeptide (TPR) repeat protein